MNSFLLEHHQRRRWSTIRWVEWNCHNSLKLLPIVKNCSLWNKGREIQVIPQGDVMRVGATNGIFCSHVKHGNSRVEHFEHFLFVLNISFSGWLSIHKWQNPRGLTLTGNRILNIIRMSIETCKDDNSIIWHKWLSFSKLYFLLCNIRLFSQLSHHWRYKWFNDH